MCPTKIQSGARPWSNYPCHQLFPRFYSGSLLLVLNRSYVVHDGKKTFSLRITRVRFFSFFFPSRFSGDAVLPPPREAIYRDLRRATARYVNLQEIWECARGISRGWILPGKVHSLGRAHSRGQYTYSVHRSPPWSPLFCRLIAKYWKERYCLWLRHTRTSPFRGSRAVFVIHPGAARV